MVGVSEIEASIISALAEIRPEVPTIRSYQGEILKDVRSQAFRLPAFLIRYVWGYATRSSDKVYGLNYHFSVTIVNRNARGERKARTETDGLYQLGDDIQKAVQHQTFGLPITPFYLMSSSFISAEPEALILVNTYKTTAYDLATLGKLSWVSETGGETEVFLPFHYTEAGSHQMMDSSEYERALDATLRKYFRPLKRCFGVELPFLNDSQKTELLSAKQAQRQFTLYLEAGGEKTCDVVWSNDFDFHQVRPGVWSGHIILTEI